MIERLFRSFQSTQALLHFSGIVSSIYLSNSTTFTKTPLACYFRQNDLSWVISDQSTHEPVTMFDALGKTILEDVTLT